MLSPSCVSTLITSAPSSARIWVANGPITTVVRSSTLTPCKGPDIVEACWDASMASETIAASCACLRSPRSIFTTPSLRGCAAAYRRSSLAQVLRGLHTEHRFADERFELNNVAQGARYA